MNKSQELIEELRISEGVDDEFVKYFNDFYGTSGIYKKANMGKDITKAQLDIALKARNKRRKFPFDGDSMDRETLRDILISMKQLNDVY